MSGSGARGYGDDLGAGLMARRLSRRGARRRLPFRLAASLVVTLGVLGALEAVARQLEPVVPEWQAPDNAAVIMVSHPTRMWGMGPGVRRNGDVTATIGENGLRGQPPELPRPAGRERVMVIGDSSFFGHGLRDDETIPARIGETLRARGVDADVVNAGIPGYSTVQSRILLDELGWSLEPTLVVVGSLWSDNNMDGFRDVDLLRTIAVYRDNPLSRSALFRTTAAWIDRERGGNGARIITWTKDSSWPSLRQRRVPLQDYAENLDAIARAAREHGAGIAFIAPACKGLVDGTITFAGWDPYFDAQAAVAAWHGVPVVGVKAAMTASGQSPEGLFLDLMHPSAAGASIIATATVDALVGAGWPGARLEAKDEAFDVSALVDRSAVMPARQDPSMSPQAWLFPGVVH